MMENNTAQERIEGVVISSTGSWYEVNTENGMLTCRIRGRLRLILEVQSFLFSYFLLILINEVLLFLILSMIPCFQFFLLLS